MSPADRPTVILLFGDDDLAIEERLADLMAKVGDPVTAAVNITRQSASRLDVAQLESQLLAIPFLAQRRMVILEMGTVPAKGSDLPDSFFALLERIPPTSVLVALERLDYPAAEKRARRKGSGRGSLDEIHAKISPLFQWVGRHSDRALAREFRSPQGARFDRWLQTRARHLDGEIDPAGASLLRESTGEDTRLADSELRKLLDYVDHSRPVTRQDVEQLTPSHAESNIFALVEALGTGEASHAMRLLHLLLAEEDARYLFSMFLRQFRLLVLAREALDAGAAPADILSSAPHRLPSFAAERVGRQALHFRPDQLRAIYHELFALDLASKTGRADLNVGLENLVAGLAP
jgi:DNA polymerase-3 subunit delta